MGRSQKEGDVANINHEEQLAPWKNKQCTERESSNDLRQEQAWNVCGSEKCLVWRNGVEKVENCGRWARRGRKGRIVYGIPGHGDDLRFCYTEKPPKGFTWGTDMVRFTI